MRMQKIEGTERVDEATGKPVATYLFDNGEEMDMSDEDYNRLVGTMPPPVADTSFPATPPPAGISSESAKLFNNYVVPPATAPIPPASSAVAQPMTEADIAKLKTNLAAPATPVTPATNVNQATLAAELNPTFVGPPMSAAGGVQPEPQPAPSQPSAMPADIGFSTTTTKESQGKVIPKDVLDQQAAAFKARKEAETAIGNANMKAAEAEAAYYDQEIKAINEYAENEQIQKVYDQARRDEAKAKLDAAAAKYEGLEVDSGRYWSQKSVGSKILAAIAVGLGAYAQSMGANRENPALTMIRAAIDNDIKAQEANMAKAGKYVEAQRGMYSDLLKELGDEELARLKTHELGLRSAKSVMQGQLAKTKNPALQANTQKAIADLDAEEAKLRAEQEARLETTQRVTTPIKPAILEPVPQNVLQPFMDLDDGYKVWNQLDAQVKQIGMERLEKYAGPFDQRILDAKVAIGLGVPEDIAKLRTAIDIARFQFVKAMTGAGVNVKELSEYQKILPNLYKDPKTALASLDQLRELARAQISSKLEAQSTINPMYGARLMPVYGKYLRPESADKKALGFKSAQGK